MLASGISLHFLNFVPQATYEVSNETLQTKMRKLARNIAAHDTNIFGISTTILRGLRAQGDFVVLSIQAGRSLLKALQDKMQADVSTKGMTSSVAYLDAFNPTEQKQAVRVTADQLTDPAWLLSAFEKRCVAMRASHWKSHAEMMNSMVTEVLSINRSGRPQQCFKREKNL